MSTEKIKKSEWKVYKSKLVCDLNGTNMDSVSSVIFRNKEDIAALINMCQEALEKGDTLAIRIQKEPPYNAEVVVKRPANT